MGGTKIKCSKCGDVIQSMHRHDLVWCKCKSIFVDGGSSYLRAGGKLEFAAIASTGEPLFSNETEAP